MKRPTQLRFMHSTGTTHSLANDPGEIATYKEKLQKARKDFPLLYPISSLAITICMVENEGLGRDL